MHTTVIDCVKFVAGVARKALVSAYEVFILRGLVSFVIGDGGAPNLFVWREMAAHF